MRKVVRLAMPSDTEAMRLSERFSVSNPRNDHTQSGTSVSPWPQVEVFPPAAGGSDHSAHDTSLLGGRIDRNDEHPPRRTGRRSSATGRHRSTHRRLLRD